MTSQEGPLSGLRVLEFSIFSVGALAGLTLADMGADVVKIEPPTGDPSRGLAFTAGTLSMEMADGRNAYYETINRGKRGVAINLKHPRGREVFTALATSSDVLIDNLRVDTLDKLGVGYDMLAKENPRLVYGQSSGFGPKGPERTRPAFDYVAQARSSFMWTLGRPDEGPGYHLCSTADVMGGFMLAQAVLAGLASRELTGRGQRVETSQFGAMLWLQNWNVGISLFTGLPYPRTPREDVANPLWNHYQCADGEWLALGFLQPDRLWSEFCVSVGRPELVSMPKFATMQARSQHNRELIAILDDIFASRTRAEWMALLHSNPDFVCEAVHRTTDVPHDPQVRANDYVFELDYGSIGPRTLMRAPYHFDGAAPRSERLAPQFGAHTWEILQQQDYSEDEIEKLFLDGAVL